MRLTIRWSSFAGGILFAALAGAFVLPWLLVAEPPLGFRAALALYLAGAVAAHLGTLAPVLISQSSRVRSVVIGVLLVVSGLAFARYLAGPSMLGILLAVWGFFLVQSLHFLLAGNRADSRAGRHPDPFQEACGRALALLDR